MPFNEKDQPNKTISLSHRVVDLLLFVWKGERNGKYLIFDFKIYENLYFFQLDLMVGSMMEKGIVTYWRRFLGNPSFFGRRRRDLEKRRTKVFRRTDRNLVEHIASNSRIRLLSREHLPDIEADYHTDKDIRNEFESEKQNRKCM